MRRRKFIAGIGSLAAAGAVATGTGAFSQMSASRAANVDVVNDTNGLVALEPGPNIESDVVRESNGELVIDFTADGNADGVNVNSRYQVGVFDSSNTWSMPGTSLNDTPALDWQDGMGDDYAFAIRNQDTAEHGIRIAYEAADTDNFNGAYIYFQFEPTGANSQYLRIRIDESNGNNVEASSDTIPAGTAYRCSFLVDTRAVDADVDDTDLSGQIRVSTF